MDRRHAKEAENAYSRGLKERTDESAGWKEFIEIDGKRFRVPYGIIRKAEFHNLKPEEMIDQQNAARLQYKLMLNDAVIKASVDFIRKRITVIYNPVGAENTREKTSVEALEAFLAENGIKITKEGTSDEDYDYYKEFYLKAFSPERIREHAPYGWSMGEWRKERGKWEKKLAGMRSRKLGRFHKWQEAYASAHNIKKEEDPQKRKRGILFGFLLP